MDILQGGVLEERLVYDQFSSADVRCKYSWYQVWNMFLTLLSSLSAGLGLVVAHELNVALRDIGMAHIRVHQDLKK